MNPRIAMRRALFNVLCLLPILIVAAIWYPMVDHYFVPPVHVADALVTRALSHPPSSTLTLLGEQTLGVEARDPSGLAVGGPEERLHFAGMFDVALALDRLEAGGGQPFETIADDVIAFCRQANALLAYSDFLWNDHAIANRIFVLTRFWRLYRQHPSFDVQGAKQVLEHVARSVRFLARDDHFTYATNHGVMQSIALLHAANAFPDLPGRDRMIQIALERLTGQLGFFVSRSGWVMEHSAGYQEFGLNLLVTLKTEMEVLGREAPREWEVKAAEAKRVLDWLTRPDGTIPNFGDSGASRTGEIQPRACALDGAGGWYWPEGYFVAWDVGTAGCAQTTVLWPNFASRAHKRPNELSVHYWVNGVDYTQSSGYWPYGDPDRPEAIGWRGSNAPHYRGERNDTDHVVMQNGHCDADAFRFIDLERRIDGDRTYVRRQVIDLGRVGLMIIDSGRSQRDAVRDSVWRIEPRLALIGPSGETVQAGTPVGGVLHTMQIVGMASSLDTLQSVYAGEGHPRPGKFSAVAAYDHVRPTPAFVISSNPTQPTLIALAPRAVDDARPSYLISAYQSPTQWRIDVETLRLVVERSGESITVVAGSGSAPARCDVMPVAAADAIRSMEASYLALAERYTTFRPWVEYRIKVTMVVASLFLAQLLLWGLLAWAVELRRKVQPYVDAAAVAGWTLLGAYITLVYLAQ